jgi:hypothetical protein
MKTIVSKEQKPAAVKESIALKKSVKKDAFDDDSFAKEASFQAWNSYKTDADRENFIRRQTYEKWCRDNERCPTEAIRPPTSYRPTQAPFKTQNPKTTPAIPASKPGPLTIHDVSIIHLSLCYFSAMPLLIPPIRIFTSQLKILV